MAFGLFSFGALSLFSLTHSWKLRVFLEPSNFGARKGKAIKGRTRTRKEKNECLPQDKIPFYNYDTIFV